MTKLYRILNKLDLYYNDNPASLQQKSQFMETVASLISSRKVRFIFRGDSNLFEQYNTEIGNLPLLACYVFCLGIKGRNFFQSKLVDRNSQFSLIWEKFHNKVCKLDFASDGAIKRTSQFLKENPILTNYFSDEHNKEQFENLSQLSISEANKVADYYLYLLHTIGRSGNGNSYFLSSSTDYLVAEKFKGNHSIIVYGWLPKKNLKRRIIKYSDVETNREFVESLHLPIYQHPIYPEQREICIKCGLLPQYIIGFQQNNRFYINPNTLNQWNDDIVYEGLNLDQKKFDDWFNDTKLKQSFMFIDGKYYVISKKSAVEL